MAFTASSITNAFQVQMTGATITFSNPGFGPIPPNATFNLLLATGGLDGANFGNIAADPVVGAPPNPPTLGITNLTVTLTSQDLDRVRSVSVKVRVFADEGTPAQPNIVQYIPLLPEDANDLLTPQVSIPLYPETNANGARTGRWLSRPIVDFTPGTPVCDNRLMPLNLIGCPNQRLTTLQEYQVSVTAQAIYADSGREVQLCGHADCVFTLV